MCLGADLKRRIPQPTNSTEPAIEQAMLSTTWIGAYPIASRDGFDLRIISRPEGTNVRFLSNVRT
jgi:hypothetical protein